MTEFVHGFKARANRIALKVRTNHQVGSCDPLCPWELCDSYDITVIPLSRLVDGRNNPIGAHFLHVERAVFSAITVQRGISRAIVHNDNHSRVRQRSNLMHELGHAFLGHRCAPLLTGEGDRHFDQKIEAEAQYLAGCLLITNEGAYEIALSGMTGAAACKVFGVSPEMLQYRLRISGALKRLSRRVRQSA